MADDIEDETRTIHGLRHRPTGKLVRVREVVTVLGEGEYASEDVSHHMTLDEAHPIYDAGSPERLANAFLPSRGGSARAPAQDDLAIDDLEPVVRTETVRRVTRAVELPMQRALVLDLIHSFDLGKGVARSIPGAAEILEAVADHAAELRRTPEPGGAYEYGGFHVVGQVVAGDPDALRAEVTGRVLTGRLPGSTFRRGLGVVELPERLSHLADRRPRPGADPRACIVVSLGDPRPLPAELVERLSPADAASPSPR